jgi:TolB-like protein/class 3 adenylate cyclase
MERTSVERRLTTILAADVVGYSRLMATDEAETLAKLKSLHADLIESKTTAFHGRVVKLMGDGILMEFGSVVEAVEFAVSLQSAVPTWNEGVRPDRPFALRIGINIGDIIAEGDDIYGDGVNISARLEGLAEPGGICVSAKVHDEVRNKVDFGFRDLGPRQVKNIPEPVHVFEVLVEGGMSGASVTDRKGARPQSLEWLAAAGFVVLLGTAAAFFWLRPPDTRPAPEALDVVVRPAKDKPSIVVLPFANLSDDPTQEFFADGMTEDLTTDLAKTPGLFVISRNSAFAYKGKAPRVAEVAAELRVEFVLEGSVRRVGDRVRINAQLIEAATDGHLWAEKFDGSLSDVFALQDKVTAKIIEALAVQLVPGDVQRRDRPGTASAAAHDAYLQGLSLYYRRTPVAPPGVRDDASKRRLPRTSVVACLAQTPIRRSRR